MIHSLLSFSFHLAPLSKNPSNASHRPLAKSYMFKYQMSPDWCWLNPGQSFIGSVFGTGFWPAKCHHKNTPGFMGVPRDLNSLTWSPWPDIFTRMWKMPKRSGFRPDTKSTGLKSCLRTRFFITGMDRPFSKS